MRTTFRRNTVAAAALLATGAIALAAPGMSKAAFDAVNAHKVDGLHADQLNKIQYFEATTTFDNFDTCDYTTVLSRIFVTTRKGVVSVHGAVSAARDTDNANEGILTTRILVDGQVASVPSSGNLENNGTQDATVVNFGGRKVPAGTHTLELQAKECGTGMAFITTESMLASFSPFGTAAVPPVLRPVAKGGAELNR